MYRVVQVGIALITLAAVVLCGCSRRSGVEQRPTNAGGKRITLCLLPKTKGLPYFTSCLRGAEQAARDLGVVDLKYDGPTDGSPEKAAAMIEKWTLKGVDVIAVSCNDPSVLGPAMKEARKKGVHVITWDADAAPDTREFFVNQATPQQIGYGLVDAMAKDLGGTEPAGKVAIVTARLTAANQNEWMKYMRERLKAYPRMELVATKPSNEDQRLAFEVTRDLMKAYPDLRGVFGISSVAFPGAAEAVKQAGKAGKVMVTGLSTPNDMRRYVEDGTVRSVLLWNTLDLGYLTVEVGAALAAGTLKRGDTCFVSRRLGKREIRGDNVLLGDLIVFTRDNIGEYDF
jgi:ABC-type sugar transport system substrate-binding protein